MKSKVVLSLDPHEGNGRNSEGAFLTLRDGRIIFAYSKFLTPEKEWEDHDPSVIAIRESSDGGLTWSPGDRILVEPGDAANVMSVSLLRLAGGRILVAYLETLFTATGALHSRPVIRFSDDELESLSPPIFPKQAPGFHCVNNDRIIQLQSGRLVMPVSFHRNTSASVAEKDVLLIFPQGLIFFMLSDDEGLTWRESTQSFYRCFPSGHGLQEPGVVELEDGRLWCWCRTGWLAGEARPRQWQAFSEDGGDTWSEPEPSQFVSPRSPLSLKRIPSTGDLLAVWNDHSGRFAVPDKPDLQDRTPLVAAISRDNGATWQHHRAIESEPDHGYCYTAIHFTGDAVLLGYCAGGPLPQGCLQRLRIRRMDLVHLYREADDASLFELCHSSMPADALAR